RDWQQLPVLGVSLRAPQTTLDAHLHFHLFFFNGTATTEIYTLSLHDALPISAPIGATSLDPTQASASAIIQAQLRSEEHTSELQSRSDLVCRLLLEKKKN